MSLNNRYQVLETEQEDQISTVDGDSHKIAPMQDGSWETTDTPTLLAKLNSQVTVPHLINSKKYSNRRVQKCKT